MALEIVNLRALERRTFISVASETHATQLVSIFIVHLRDELIRRVESVSNPFFFLGRLRFRYYIV